ncbi:MAG: hypothetical protein AAF360_15630 [Pseudomonadota bacterium]
MTTTAGDLCRRAWWTASGLGSDADLAICERPAGVGAARLTIRPAQAAPRGDADGDLARSGGEAKRPICKARGQPSPVRNPCVSKGNGQLFNVKCG